MSPLENEPLIGLKVAAKSPQLTRDGRNPDVSTLWRWVGPRGMRGIRLESRRIGGFTYTSEAAISRFLAKLNGEDAPAVGDANREAQIEKARQEVAACGV